MSKWRVERERHAYTGELLPGWVVKKQEDGVLPTFKTWWKGAAWETWQEALAYADRKARTREVVLPGPDWLTRHGVQLDADRYRTSAKANSLECGIYIDIPTQDLRPLALALLAHAERIEE